MTMSPTFSPQAAAPPKGEAQGGLLQHRGSCAHPEQGGRRGGYTMQSMRDGLRLVTYSTLQPCSALLNIGLEG
jgi:hypothetical protein